MFYINIDKDLNIDKTGQKGINIKKGGVFGKGTSNSEFIRVYGKDTAQHTHVEQQTPSGIKNIQDTLFPTQQQELKK